MIDQYQSMVATRKLLESLSISDGPHQTMAKTLLKNYPDDIRIGCMVGQYEERACGLWTRKSGSQIEFHPDKGGWIYWEETWADWAGPFETYTDCASALQRYADRLDKPIGGG